MHDLHSLAYQGFLRHVQRLYLLRSQLYFSILLPLPEDHAYEILLSLQGRAHEVYTGVAILSYNNAGEKEIINHAVETKVHVHEMSEEEIRAYIATGDPMDKAGAYGIQGSFAAYIDGIEGDYYNVVGLPVSYVYQQLKKR